MNKKIKNFHCSFFCGQRWFSHTLSPPLPFFPFQRFLEGHFSPFLYSWYWFILTIYGTGYSWVLPLADGLELRRSRFLEVLASHHLIITYASAFLGLILFILSLRRSVCIHSLWFRGISVLGHQFWDFALGIPLFSLCPNSFFVLSFYSFSLRYQFSHFAIMLLTCLFVVGQSVFQIANISDGLIWFFISTSTVIINDIFAYIFGIFFGRTRLIKLSPKKTVEGFLGKFDTWANVATAFQPLYFCYCILASLIAMRPYL